MDSSGDPPLETGTTPALAEAESFVSNKYHEMGKVMKSDLENYLHLMEFIDSIASDQKGSNVNEPESEAPNVTSKSKGGGELPPILRDIFYEWAKSGKNPPVWSAIKKQLTDDGFIEVVIDFKKPEIMDFFIRMNLTYPWADHPKGDWRPEESEEVLSLAGSPAPWNRLAVKKGGSYKRKSKKRKSKKKKTRRRRSRR